MRRAGRYSRFRERRGRMAGVVPTVSELAYLATLGRCEEDRRVRGLLKAFSLTRDPEIAQEAFEYINHQIAKQVVEPDPFAPPINPEQARGELHLGQVKNSDCEFGLWRQELVQGTFIAGRIGSGKTTFVRRLLRQLIILAMSIAISVKILVFDIKGDYTGLAEEFPGVWVFKVPGEGFRWNPLEPPVRDVNRWAGIFASVFANAAGFYGGMGTEALFYDYLLELYAKYDTENGVYPCLFDMLDYLNWKEITKKVDKRSEEYRWFARIKNRIKNLCNIFGETVSCSKGYPLHELLDHHVILDMTGLKQDGQSFLTETLLSAAICRRIVLNEKGGRIRNLAVFDEAKRLMPKYREEIQNAISNMSDCLGFGREFGIGFVIAECHPNLLADSAKATSYTRVCFGLTHEDHVKDSSAALGLDSQQADEIYRLRVGEAIVRLAGRIDRPFVLSVEA